MNTSIYVFFALISIAAVSGQKGKSEKLQNQQQTIKCFKCNSKLDPICGDYFYNVASPAINESYIELCLPKDGMLPFCRKIKMYLEYKGEVRVERGCAHQAKYEDDCYQRRSEDFVKDVCHCKEPFCNGAPAHMISITAMLISMTAFLL